VRRSIAMMTVLVLVGGVALARQWVPLESGWAERPAEFEVLNSNSFRTTVELEVTGIYIDEVEAGGRAWQTVELGIEAGGLLRVEGSPQLPVVARFLKIPDDRAVRVEVLELEEVVLSGYDVEPTQPPLPENQTSLPFVIDDERYGTDAVYPAESFQVSDPMIMRDLRLVQLVLQPVRYNPVTKELRVARKLRVQLTYDGQGDINVKHRRLSGVSRAFEPLYRKLVANYDFGPPQDPRDGTYLIITHDNFADAVAPFAEWKRQKGWRTIVKTTSDIGGSDSATIRAYVANAYNNWPMPPDYLLLVGDAPMYLQCYYYSGQTHASDLPYTTHEGGDILADMMVGRVSAQSLTEAGTALNKLYLCEKDPYMDNTDWFNRAVSVAGYEGGDRFWTVVIRIRNYVMGRPFVQFDTLFQRWNLNTAQNLTDSLNQGRSWMLYRGHGSETYWDNVNPDFTTAHVHALSNGRMTPIVIGPTCLAGDFDYSSGDCLAEAWLKAGTPDSAKGGTGYFGSSEVSYSGYNDSLAAGAFFSYSDSMLYTFAQATQWGKLFMLEAYPMPDDISEKEIWMFNNLGEPEFNIWSDVPKMLEVTHPATVIVGSFPFGVTVTDGEAAVENALVCVMSRQDTSIYHVGYTDGSGQVQFTINSTMPGDSLSVTVTGRNLHPYLGTAMTITPNTPYVMYLKHSFTDSQPAGNGDGVANPGEEIELFAWVKNYGGVSGSSVSGRLYSNTPGVTVTDSVASFGSIAAGDSVCCQTGFGLMLDPNLPDNFRVSCSLVCRDADDSVWSSKFSMRAYAARPCFVDVEIDDSQGIWPNGRIDPGEQVELEVTIANQGMGNAFEARGVLRPADTLLTVVDTHAFFGVVAAGSTKVAEDRFKIQAHPNLPPGTQLHCELAVLWDHGNDTTLFFDFSSGGMVATDPVPDSGPGSPRYFAYDDCDRFYTEAPEYDWVELRGTGTVLTLADQETKPLALPASFGPFVFHGESFDTISVCSNGWIAPGVTADRSWQNRWLPTDRNRALIAVLWDDLLPEYGGGVLYRHDEADHRFVIEYDSVHYSWSRDNWDECQIVIYDTTMAADDGNSVWLFQYKTSNYMVSVTAGEQHANGALGMNLMYNTLYHRGCSEIVPGRAIKFTTNPPELTGVEESPVELLLARHGLLVAPNPVNRTALVHWQIERGAEVSLQVFDPSGRVVRTLEAGRRAAGTYTTKWNGCDDAGRELARGIYFVRLDAGGERTVSKTVLTD
jgi:hypothetical protein